MSELTLTMLRADEAIMAKHDLTELQRRSEQRRKELAQYADHEPTTQERRTWRIMLRAALIQQRDSERGLL